MEYNQNKRYKQSTKRFILPKWFRHLSILELISVKPRKNGKLIINKIQYDNLLYNVCHSTKFISLSILDNYIVSDLLYNRFIYLYDVLMELTICSKINININENIIELLKIRICDYDWNFICSNIDFDKESTDLLFSCKS
jgi:hypothetical protein